MVKLAAFSIIQAWIAIVLIPQLGNDSFRKREKAHNLLAKSVPLGCQYLNKLKTEDVEIDIRRHHILLNWYAATANQKAEMLPDNYPAYPWIDGMPDKIKGWYEDASHRQFIVDSLLDEAHQKLKINRTLGRNEDWKDYRYATKLMLIDRFRQGWKVERMRTILNEMKEADVRWMKKNKYRPPFPTDLPK